MQLAVKLKLDGLKVVSLTKTLLLQWVCCYLIYNRCKKC